MSILCEVILFIFIIMTCSNTVFDEAVSKDQYQYDDPNLYDYEYDDDTQTSADDDIKKTHRPVIITQPTHVQVPLGGIINLPCKTDFLPESVQLIWSKLADTQDILVIGETVLPTTTKRINVKVTSEGSTLVIKDVMEDDYGQFQCKAAVQGDDAPQIVHTVTQLEHKKPKSNSVQTINAKLGDDINLSCAAVADPEPTITWSKENGVLPGGIKISVGNTLKLKNVTQKQAGTYVCVAENGVSKTVTNKIIIIVDESDDIFVKRDIKQGKLLQLSSSIKNMGPLQLMVLLVTTVLLI